MIFFRSHLAALCMTLCTVSAFAQSLSPEEIKRMLDEEASASNPYAALLNDPDPKRSIGALRIMMESGDPRLVEIAKEFGLLSSDPRVQNATVEHYMSTAPRLAIEFDGSNLTQNHSSYKRLILNWGGTFTPELIGYASFKVGGFSSEQGCFVWEGHDNCAVRVDESGIFIMGSNMSGKVAVSPEGILVGTTKLSSNNDTVPMTVRLLD